MNEFLKEEKEKLRQYVVKQTEIILIKYLKKAQPKIKAYLKSPGMWVCI